jgi:AcrR family transcriptional regulator
MGRKSLAKERRTQIVEAYYRSVLKYGLENSSIAKIAGEAGMTPSIITHYFKTKDNLAMELTHYVLNRQEDRYLGYIADIEDPWERLETAIRIMFSGEFIDQDMKRVFFAIFYRSSRNKQVREALNNMYEAYFDHVKDLLLDAADAGRISPEQAEETAVILVSLQDGLYGHWALNPAKANPGMPMEMLLAWLRTTLKGKSDRADNSKSNSG